MSVLNNIRKSVLKLISQELGQTVIVDARMIEIKTVIEDTDIFKTGPEFVRVIIKSIAEDRKTETEEEQSKSEYERVRLARLEKKLELEKLRLQSASENVDNNVSEYVVLKVLKMSRKKVFKTSEEAVEYLFSEELESEIIVLPPEVDELTNEEGFDDTETLDPSVRDVICPIIY
ncbi:uncharacterized protein NPIL_87661 [Nephila pilipes]|uniref:Uncharacterized protein n=1 Tax=Nephila pilipes TaxID=299642 RepID=A0A8X6P0D6_NEPPI|nr:uncharacterized protein NPIL_87661 [Nephila pilipes]